MTTETEMASLLDSVCFEVPGSFVRMSLAESNFLRDFDPGVHLMEYLGRL